MATADWESQGRHSAGDQRERERERLAAGAGSQSIYEHTVWGQQSESLLQKIILGNDEKGLLGDSHGLFSRGQEKQLDLTSGKYDDEGWIAVREIRKLFRKLQK